MRRALGKKAQIEYMTEIVFSLLLYFVVLIILIWASSQAQLRVAATVEADNAAFACQNNLQMFLNYDANKDNLIAAYATGDYSKPKASAETLFNKIIGTNWELQILPMVEDKEKKVEPYKIGACKIKQEGKEVLCSDKVTCTVFLPLPCTETTPCLLRAILVRGYVT